MSEWYSIKNMGMRGMQPDLMPQCREPQSLDMAVNMRARGPNIVNAGGYTDVDDTDNSPSTIMYARTIDNRFLILPGDTAIRKWRGNIMEDITGDPVADGVGERWHGGWLSGALCLGNQFVMRTWRPDFDATTVPMFWTQGSGGQTWESLLYACEVSRPYRDHLFAGNMKLGGTLADRFPRLVRWSAEVSPGSVPNEWEPDATNFAGGRELSDTEGAVIDMAPLRESLMIYKEDAIYICNYRGGNEVFDFRMLDASRGVFARDCVVEHEGLHYVQGVEDIYVVDQNRVQSIIYGQIKDFWLQDRDARRGKRNWVSLDPVREEILFAYVSADANPAFKYPNRMLVLNTRNQTWWLRDYGLEIPHAKNTLEIDATFADISNFILYGLDTANAKVLDLETAPSRNGANVPAYFLRTGLFGEPGVDWVQVDRAQVQLTGANGVLKLGEQAANDAIVNYRSAFTVNPATDYKTDARQNGNQIAYRVDIDANTAWQLCAMNLEIQRSGGRG